MDPSTLTWEGWTRILAWIDSGARYAPEQAAEAARSIMQKAIEETPQRETLRYAHVLSNLLAAEGETTDEALARALAQGNFRGAMLLATARNTLPLPRAQWFDADPAAARTWFTSAARLVESGAGLKASTHARLVEHFELEHAQLQTDEAATYYAAGLLGPGSGRTYKSQINAWVQGATASVAVTSRPKRAPKPLVGVVTGAWRPGNVVARNYRAYLQALQPDYHIQLVHLGQGPAFQDLFDSVKTISGPEEALWGLSRNSYTALLFLDIGTTVESLILANRRWCPLQMSFLGAQSTWNAVLNYQVTGDDVEAEDGQQLYSEKLLRIPGAGVIFERPPGARPEPSPFTPVPLVVNCPWHPQKMSPELVRVMARIRDHVPDVVFRLFPAGGLLRGGAQAAFLRELCDEIGACFFVEDPLLPEAYLRELAKGAITLDSFPYGGCNVVVDSLYAGVPVLALEGASWPGRVGAWAVRKAGLSSWVASTPVAYADLAVQKLTSLDTLHEARKHLRGNDLSNLFDQSPADGFRQTFDRLTSVTSTGTSPKR